MDTTNSAVVGRADLTGATQAAGVTPDGCKLWLVGRFNEPLTVLDLGRYR